jgi:hypothetical protein
MKWEVGHPEPLSLIKKVYIRIADLFIFLFTDYYNTTCSIYFIMARAKENNFDQSQEPLLERLSVTPEPEQFPSSNLPSKKRKRGPEKEHTSKKAAKRSKRKNERAAEEEKFDIGSGINNAFSHMDSQLMADYIAQRTRKHESDLSAVELEDKYLPGG